MYNNSPTYPKATASAEEAVWSCATARISASPFLYTLYGFCDVAGHASYKEEMED